MLCLIYGLPISWALGALPFAYMGIAVVMLALMAGPRPLQVAPGLGLYFAFLAWAAVAAVNVQNLGQAIGFAWRLGDFVALGVIMIYYANARQALTSNDILNGLVFIWGVVVFLGAAATLLPDLRLTTPVGVLMPGGLTSNALVNELVFPRMAEVQQPWGVPEPFIRPAAPFPYTNSWGMAYALLTPVVSAVAIASHSRLRRNCLFTFLLVSAWPAIATSNRGMFLGLAVAIAYLIFRLALAGRVLPAFIGLLCASVGTAILVASGVVAQILGRQEYSDSTGTRSSVYQATYETTLESPLLGWANPKEVPGVDVALGTQGYVWTLMFCFGFVGLGLFVAFLLAIIVRTWRVYRVEHMAMHGLLVTAAFMMMYYGLGTTQLFIVLIVAVTLLRKQDCGRTRDSAITD